MRYLKQHQTRRTPQSQRIPGTDQVRNSAGGYGWAVDDWTRLERFLVLGSEGGSYYAGEQQLTAANAEAVRRCVEADGERAVERIVALSEAGRAPKNDPAIFALALATAHGNLATRRAAFEAVPRVCRTGTHLFHFVAYVEGFRGWGRGLRRAVASWYNGQPAERVAFQAVKYQQRDGWSHRDLLRLAHPLPATPAHGALYKWIVDGAQRMETTTEQLDEPALRLMRALAAAQAATTAAEVARVIRDERLPREAVPTQWLKEPTVWEALLDDLPMTALLRNLATLTRVGLLAPMSATSKHVVAQLGDVERLRAARVHPIGVLSALLTYGQGHGARGGGRWTPNQAVVDALDAAFYASFGNVTPTGKRWVLGVDVSGSMDYGQVAGVPGLRPRHAAAAMALVTAAVEPQHVIYGFTSGMGTLIEAPSRFPDYPAGLTQLAISPRQRLDDVLAYMRGLPFGGTDCALPMLYATRAKLEVDAFVIYTDSETWAGGIHPAQALQRYREQSGRAAKLIVVGLVANGFSIADPDDAGMLDVVGFDSATPDVIAAFVDG